MTILYSLFSNSIILFMLTFVLSIILFYYAKIILQKKQFGQIVRDDGPETHLKKKGTPTMAGVVFIIILLLSEFLFLIFKDLINSTRVIKLIIFIVIFGFLGMIDDYLKVSKKNTKGLPSLFKFILQILFAGFGLIICFNYNTLSNIFLFLFMIFIIVGTNNGVNFTDGLDGLCTVVTIVVAVLFLVLSIRKGDVDLILLNTIMIATLIAFLIFNHYPAKLFMGDTGSLLLGGYVAFVSIELGIEFFLPLFGIIYMIEVLSVIIQVSYFKITHGKRIFKMAPIHHHFEKCGMTENQIVLMFGAITLITCCLTYYFVM